MCYILDAKPKYSVSTHKQFSYKQGKNRAFKTTVNRKNIVHWPDILRNLFFISRRYSFEEEMVPDSFFFKEIIQVSLYSFLYLAVMSVASLYAYEKTTDIPNVYRFGCQIVLCIKIIASFSFDVFSKRMPQSQEVCKNLNSQGNTFSLQRWSEFWMLCVWGGKDKQPFGILLSSILPWHYNSNVIKTLTGPREGRSKSTASGFHSRYFYR